MDKLRQGKTSVRGLASMMTGIEAIDSLRCQGTHRAPLLSLKTTGSTESQGSTRHSLALPDGAEGDIKMRLRFAAISVARPSFPNFE